MIALTPKRDCPICHGTGTVTDWVPWGEENVPMHSDCDCVFEGITEKTAKAIEAGAEYSVKDSSKR